MKLFGLVTDLVGSIVGMPFLWFGYVLACVAEASTRIGCWCMGLEYEEEAGD